MTKDKIKQEIKELEQAIYDISFGIRLARTQEIADKESKKYSNHLDGLRREIKRLQKLLNH